MVTGDFLLDLGDWPGGQLLATECACPYAEDGGVDLELPVKCELHRRTVWWCLNAGVLWCDGGPPKFWPHTWPGGLS